MTSSVSALYRTKGVLGSVIFIRLSFWISVNAMFSSSHCKLLYPIRRRRIEYVHNTHWAGVEPGWGGAFFKIPLGFEVDRLGGGLWSSLISDDIEVLCKP
jgi:hypothetical protein